MTTTNKERIKRKSTKKEVRGERYEIRTLCMNCGEIVLQYHTTGMKPMGRMNRCYRCAALLWDKLQKDMENSGVPRHMWMNYVTNRERLGSNAEQ